MKRIGMLILGLLLLSLGVLSLAPQRVSALPATSGGNEGGVQACEALIEVGVECDPTTDPDALAGSTIRKLLNLFSVIVGAVCVLMIIYGGFKFVTSQGDADGTKGARNTIIYAVIGLAVIILAQTIVYFTFAKANQLQSTPPTTTTTVV